MTPETKDLIRMVVALIVITLLAIVMWPIASHANPTCPLNTRPKCLTDLGYNWVHWHVANRRDCCGDVPEDICASLINGKETRMWRADKICFDVKGNDEWYRFYVENYWMESPVEIVEDIFCEGI